MSVDHQIAAELEALGYEPEIVECITPNGKEKAVIFPYRIGAGRFKGETRTFGVTTQCEAVGYPEVPPHWIFISPPITDTRDGPNNGTGSFAAKDWVLLSRPPGAFWDSVRHKSMRAYLEHLSKVCARI